MASSKRVMSSCCAGRIFCRASAGENHCARSTSGNETLRPLFGGHSSSKRFEVSVAGSKSPSSAHAVTILPPACTTSPRGRNLPSGRAPVSSWNSRLATASASSPCAYSPFGMDQAPASLLAQNGPPGCISKTSISPSRRLNIKIPALRLGMTRSRPRARTTAGGSQAVVPGNRPRHLDWNLGIGLGAQGPRRARRRAFETALEPCRKARRYGEIHVDRAADDRGDVEISDGEVLAQQVRTAGKRSVEHLERRLQRLERFGKPLRIAILDWQAHRMQRPDVDAAVDLLHRPQAPLPGLGLAFQRRRIEPSMLLGEVKRDRQRFPQDKAIVFDRRQAAVGIDGEIIRLARPGGADLDRNVLVIEPELLGDPERAKGAGARDAVNAQFGHRYSAWRRCSSHDYYRVKPR